MSEINNYIAQNKERFLNELIDLLKIPSISADSAYLLLGAGTEIEGTFLTHREAVAG